MPLRRRIEKNFDSDVVAEYALKAVPDELRMTIEMGNNFEDQFISKYLPRILPWALNYDCGGAEYPRLFADWDEIELAKKKCK